MIIFLILLSILCKSLPWFKNNLSNLSFIKQNLSCLNIFFSILLIGNNIKNIVLNFLKTIKFILFFLSFIFLIFKFIKFVFFILNIKDYYNSLEFYLFFVSFVFSILTFIFVFNIFNLKNNIKLKKILFKFYVVLIIICSFLVYFISDLFLFDYDLRLYSNSGEKGIENLNSNKSVVSRTFDETSGESSTNVNFNIKDSDINKIAKNISESNAVKEGVKEGVAKGVDKLVEVGTKVASNVGAGAVAGSLAATAFKTTVSKVPGSPPVKLAAGLVTGSVAGFTGVVAAKLGQKVADNINLNNSATLSEDRSPSPDSNFDVFSKSILENTEISDNLINYSPLETILAGVILFLLISIFLTLYTIFLISYVYSKNSIINKIKNQTTDNELENKKENILDKFVNKLLNPLFENKLQPETKNKTNFIFKLKQIFKNKLNKYSNNFIYFLICINLICFFICLILSILFLLIILGDLDSYCKVHLEIFTNTKK